MRLYKQFNLTLEVIMAERARTYTSFEELQDAAKKLRFPLVVKNNAGEKQGCFYTMAGFLAESSDFRTLIRREGKISVFENLSGLE